MGNLWEGSRPFAIALILWVGGSLLFFLGIRLPFSGPIAALRGGSATELAAHYESPGRPNPQAKRFDDVERTTQQERKALNEALADARRFIAFVPGPRFAIREDIAEHANEYMNVRERAMAELRELANKAGVQIPDELDPRAEPRKFPARNEIEGLLFRMAMSDRVARAAVASQVPRVVEIKHDLGAPRGTPLAERLMTVKLEAGLDVIVDLIDRVSTPPADKDNAGSGILVLRRAKVSAAGEGRVAAELTLAALTVGEVVPDVKPKPLPGTTEPERGALRPW